MTVYLVGAGPGDPGLITARGAHLLSVADVVIHDRLVNPALLRLAPEAAQLIDVGKRAGADPSSQETINALLIDHAKRFQCVVRLKGGDPYIFGRGGEEALALERAGCVYEVVPGVSAVSSVAAAAGVPITMRGLSSGFVAVTGHDAGEEMSRHTWRAIAQSELTVVVFMGATKRREIAEALIGGGRPSSTPVLIVENGTTERQRSRRTTLGELESAAIETPAMIVIGEVAAMSLASHHDRPLSSLSVVVTRQGSEQETISSMIERAGGRVVNAATIAIEGPSDGGSSLRSALSRLESFDWVVFSSKNAVERAFHEVRDARAFGRTKVAALGSSTADRLREFGINAEFVPDRFIGESLVEQFPIDELGSAKRALVIRAAAGRDVVEVGLRKLGFDVEVVEAYQTVHPRLSRQQLENIAAADAITFTSPSTIEGLLRSVDASSLPPVIATIGPVTTDAAKARGLSVSVEAEVHTAEGLAYSLIDYIREHRAERS